MSLPKLMIDCDQGYKNLLKSFLPVAKCPTPELDQDGHFTIAPLQEFYKQGDKIVYSCKEGFVNVAADNRRTCLENGTWSGNEAICERE